MHITETKKEILEHWNSKNIIVHKRMNVDIDNELGKALKKRTVDEIKTLIDFYAVILEVGTKDEDRQYFWTYKWNLVEFLARGLKKFDGQETDNYKRRQRVETPEAIILKR